MYPFDPEAPCDASLSAKLAGWSVLSSYELIRHALPPMNGCHGEDYVIIRREESPDDRIRWLVIQPGWCSGEIAHATLGQALDDGNERVAYMARRGTLPTDFFPVE